MSGDYGIDTVPDVRFAAISEAPVAVIDCEYISDVYRATLSFEDKGKFIYEHHENLSQMRHNKIREWVLKWITDGNWISKPEEPVAQFYRDKWSEYWQETEKTKSET